MSILQWDFCRTSSFRKWWSQKAINSALTLGYVSFSQAILACNFSLVASNFSSRPLVDLVRMPVQHILNGGFCLLELLFI